MKKAGLSPPLLLPDGLYVDVKRDVDVAAGGAGIRADFVCLGDERFGSGLVQTGQGDVEDDAEAEEGRS